MSMMWFLLGALAVVILWGVKSWFGRRQARLSLLSWSGMVVDIVFILFTLAWFFTSLAENEVQAARAGLIVFGGMSLVLFGLARYLVGRDIKRTVDR
jgi:hypothetical protein